MPEFKLKDKTITAEIVREDVEHPMMQTIDETHVILTIPFDMDMADVELFIERDSDRILYAMELALSDFDAYRDLGMDVDNMAESADSDEHVYGLYDEPYGYEQSRDELFRFEEGDGEFLPGPDSDDPEVLRVFGNDYLVTYQQGRGHVEMSEFGYDVYFENLDDLAGILELVTDDLIERLSETVHKAIAKWSMELPGVLKTLPQIFFDAGIGGPVQTHLDENLVFVHPALVQYPVRYIDYTICSALAHLMSNGDVYEHDRLMDEAMPDWRDRRANAS